MKKQLLFHVFKLRLHKEYVSVLTLLEYHLILLIIQANIQKYLVQ